MKRPAKRPNWLDLLLLILQRKEFGWPLGIPCQARHCGDDPAASRHSGRSLPWRKPGVSRGKRQAPRCSSAVELIAFLFTAGLTWLLAATPAGAFAALVAVPADISLGELRQVEHNPFAFTIKNTARHTVKITNILRPCSCTQIDLPQDFSLSPGGSVDVRGDIDTMGRRGRLDDMAIAISYRIGQEITEYTLILPINLDVLPSIATSATSVDLRDRQVDSLSLKPGTVDEFRIRGIETSDAYIKWKLIDSSLDQDCKAFHIKFWIDESKLPDEAISLEGPHWVQFSTSVASEPVFRVPVMIEDRSSAPTSGEISPGRNH